MTNAFRIVLDNASVRRAAAEGVSETVIAAVLLLHERSVDKVAAKLVSRCPSCHPPGTLEALKIRRAAPSPEPVASISTDRPPAGIEPDAEDRRRAQQRRLAGLRVRAAQTGSEREHVVPPLTARFSEQSKFGALEARRTSGTHAAATSAVPKKSILNLGVNFVEPLLRSVGPLSIGRALSFQFCNPIFGGA